ncbi:hypothetical protein P7H17_02160 [Paenibacillus larvae]|nr:hypothetical protein [Paenibacillus larvae]MDT2285150.1 hypothetical protein [Paenibacillus larvae]
MGSRDRVGRGYLNQEEKTREAFTEDPFAKGAGSTGCTRREI